MEGWNLDWKSIDSAGKAAGGTSQLHVCFLNKTDFSTRYTREVKLISLVVGQEKPELLANLALTWTLHWVGENKPPKGSLKIKLKHNQGLPTTELCRLLYQWARDINRIISLDKDVK